MSQRNQDRLPRRERRARERMAAKEAQRQSNVAEEKDSQGGSLTDSIESTTRQLQQNALPLLVFLVAIFVFYFPALSGEFIWDDMTFSEERAIYSWSGLWDIWFVPLEIADERHYWPITYTMFWLQHKLFGLNPIGYHIVNCLLYFVNVVLIWRLLLKLEVPGAWAISMVFTVHPLHVESVAWLIEQKDLLAALFYLGAVHVWLRFRESSNLKTYAFALGLYALSLLSKSIAVTLPATLLVLLWWKQERVSVHDVMRLLPFFIVGFAITLGDYLLYVSQAELDLDYSFWERVLIAAQAVWFYVGKLLWPTNLMVIYPHWDVSVENLIAWLFVAVTAGILIFLWGYRHRIGKGPLAGVAFFVITLSPILGFVDYGHMRLSFVADRYQYLAGLGVMAVLMGGAVHAIQLYVTSFKPVVMSIFAVLVVGLGTMTWHQATVYQDETTFFGHIVAHNPTAHNAYANLGNALRKQQRYEEALVAFQKEIEQDAESTLAYGGIADSYYEMGQHDKAMEWTNRALALGRTKEAEQQLLQAKGNDGSGNEMWQLLELHKMYIRQGDTDKANVYLQRILKQAKGNPEALQSAADTLRNQKRYTEAIEIYRKILATDRDFGMAYAGMGDVLFRLERHEEAIKSLKRSVELDPLSSSATTSLLLMGQAASKLGRSSEATQYYERAVELDPQNAGALEFLAMVRFGEKRYEEALRLITFARDNHPEVANFHSNRGHTLYHLGRLEEAARSYETALSLDPNMGDVRSILKQLRKKIDEQK